MPVLRYLKKGLFLYSSALCLLTFIPDGYGQQLRDEKRQVMLQVDDRTPQDFIAEGVHYAGFRILPKLDITGKYDSNILASDTNEQSDFILKIEPQIRIQKKYKDHSFLLSAQASYDQYKRHEDENSYAYRTLFNGNIVATNHVSLPFSIEYSRRLRDRTIPLIQSKADERLAIDKFAAQAGISHRFNRLVLSLYGEYEDLKNENGRSLIDNTDVIYNDDDRSRIGARARIKYALGSLKKPNAAEHILFADFIYGKIAYKNRKFETTDYTGPKGDYKEYGILSGFETSYKGLLFANIGVGYKKLVYDDLSLEDNDILNLAAEINYTLSPKLTVNFDASRDISQDTGFTQGVILSEYGISADYELLHDLYLGAGAAYRSFDFQTGGRKDEDVQSTVYLKHYNSRNIETGLELNHIDRTSNIPNADFDRYEILLRLIGRL